MNYHKSVLLKECIEGLKISSNGIYVDVTYGGGGHSNEILKILDNGKLFAFDRDQDVLQHLPKNKNFKLIQANYKNIKSFLRLEGVNKVDGILADLGISSHQIDVAHRGFSFRFDAPLDMRMNLSSSLTAKQVINEYSQDDLSDIFYHYGDLKQSRSLSRAIINQRDKKHIETTFELVDSVKNIIPEKKRNQFLSQLFQSVRIEVNNEIESLKKMLEDGVSMLNSGGRFVVISYHSLEDRLVKNLFKRGSFTGHVKKDFYGNIIKDLKEINRKVIVASNLEKLQNNRARSAKLRIAEKILN